MAWDNLNFFYFKNVNGGDIVTTNKVQMLNDNVKAADQISSCLENNNFLWLLKITEFGTTNW